MALDKKESEGKKVIHIKHWPEGDRPRERLLEKGPEALILAHNHPTDLPPASAKILN
jgi:DNA repair protein RadC